MITYDMTLNIVRMKLLKMKVKRAVNTNVISDNNQLCAQTNTCFNLDTKKLYFLDYPNQTYCTFTEITLCEDA